MRPHACVTELSQQVSNMQSAGNTCAADIGAGVLHLGQAGKPRRPKIILLKPCLRPLQYDQTFPKLQYFFRTHQTINPQTFGNFRQRR